MFLLSNPIQSLCDSLCSSQPPEYEALLQYFGFDDWNAMWSIYILVPYAVAVNLLVLWALQPQRSQLRRFKTKAEDRTHAKRKDGSSRDDSRSSSMAMTMESFANVGQGSSFAGRPTSQHVKGSLVGSTLSSPLLGEIPEDNDDEGTDLNPAVNTPLLDSEKELPAGNPSGRRGSWSVADFKRNSENISLVTNNTGLNMTFSGLNYAVHAPDNTKSDETGMLSILSATEGRAGAGEMVALMGASGAGKSTLLDILAGRKTLDKKTKLGGTLLFNGNKRTRRIMRRSAYVTQDNVHLASLSVRQTLEFAAALRMENSSKR